MLLSRGGNILQPARGGLSIGESPAVAFEIVTALLLFSVFQSETSFNLISEKCDILSILRDHPENRIYQRKIQVRQRVRRKGA